MDACAATAEVLYETSLSSDERGETSAVRRLQVLFPWPEHQQVPVHAACTKTRSNVACVAGVRKRREKGIRARDHARGRREERPTRSRAPKFPIPLLTPATRARSNETKLPKRNVRNGRNEGKTKSQKKEPPKRPTRIQ